MPRFSCSHQQWASVPCAECNPKEWAKLSPGERERLETQEAGEREAAAAGGRNTSAPVSIDHESFRELAAKVDAGATFAANDRERITRLEQEVTSLRTNMGSLWERVTAAASGESDSPTKAMPSLTRPTTPNRK